MPSLYRNLINVFYSKNGKLKYLAWLQLNNKEKYHFQLIANKIFGMIWNKNPMFNHGWNKLIITVTLACCCHNGKIPKTFIFLIAQVNKSDLTYCFQFVSLFLQCLRQICSLWSFLISYLFKITNLSSKSLRPIDELSSEVNVWVQFSLLFMNNIRLPKNYYFFQILSENHTFYLHPRMGNISNQSKKIK